jgi:uncharacterized phage-associated protein
MSAPYSATTIAEWFIAWTEEVDEARLSNLKLQKLPYYAQGHYLASTGSPLFGDEIQAWSHGPVVPNVYHEYKDFGRGDISLSGDDSVQWNEVDAKTTEFLMKVWNTYGGLAAWRLRSMTHEEAPWLDQFNRGGRNLEISDDSLERFFEDRTQMG